MTPVVTSRQMANKRVVPSFRAPLHQGLKHVALLRICGVRVSEQPTYTSVPSSVGMLNRISACIHEI